MADRSAHVPPPLVKPRCWYLGPMPFPRFVHGVPGPYAKVGSAAGALGEGWFVCGPAMTACRTGPTGLLGDEVDYHDLGCSSTERAGNGSHLGRSSDVAGQQTRPCGQTLGLGHAAVGQERSAPSRGLPETTLDRHDPFEPNLDRPETERAIRPNCGRSSRSPRNRHRRGWRNGRSQAGERPRRPAVQLISGLVPHPREEPGHLRIARHQQAATASDETKLDELHLQVGEQRGVSG